MFKLYGSIQKVEDNDDGTITVHGIASSEARDHSGEIVRADAMRAALPDYSKFPALREMHQPMAAGKVVEAEVDEDGITHIAALVVDPVAIVKVRTGVYAGFSIGGKVAKRDPQDRSIITALRLVEISLVDSPCNPDAQLTMWKADTMTDFKPAHTEVIQRAKDLAKAAGTARFKDYLFEASQELIAEHLLEKGEILEPEAIETPAGDPPVAEPEASVEPPAGDAPDAGEPEASAEPVVEEPKAAADAPDPEDDDAGGEGPEGPEAKEAADAPDPAAALAAAIQKGQEIADASAADPEPEADAASPFVDFGKAAAALRAISLSGDDDEIRKGLYSVSRFADLLESFSYLASSSAYEAAGENDGSAVPAQLAEAVKNLGQILIAMATEEVAELIAGLPEQPECCEIIYAADGVEPEVIELAGQIVDLVKADADLLGKAGDRLAKRAEIDPESDLAKEAARVPELEAEVERLQKALGDAAPAVDDLTKRLGETIEGLKGEIAELTTKFAALDQTPLPPKTGGPAAIRTIQKGDDSTGDPSAAREGLGGLSPEQFQKAWDDLPEKDKGEILVKVALAQPTLINLRPSA